MAKPNPIVLLMGTGPLATIAGAAWASKLPLAARYAATFACVALAVMCVVFAVAAFFDLKKRKREDEAKALERKRLRDRRSREAPISPAGAGSSDIGARPASAGDRSSRAGS